MTTKRGNTNRTKGHAAERLYANKFKKLGFDHCVTSRYGSRMHDDAGIDLINTYPFNVQIKAGKQRGMNISKVISYMKERVVELFPPNTPEHENISIVIHRKEVGRGNTRTEADDLVHMTYKDFVKLLKHKENGSNSRE